ncbi:hypothetical protein D3C86_1468810 [compost metagenome]
MLDPRVAELGGRGLGPYGDPAHRAGSDRQLPGRRLRPADHFRKNVPGDEPAAVRTAPAQHPQYRQKQGTQGRSRQRAAAGRHLGTDQRRADERTWRNAPAPGLSDAPAPCGWPAPGRRVRAAHRRARGGAGGQGPAVERGRPVEGERRPSGSHSDHQCAPSRVGTGEEPGRLRKRARGRRPRHRATTGVE